MVKRLDYNEIKRYVENEGYKLLSNEYINNSTPLEMICPEGHECQIAFGNFKLRNRRCSKCYGNKKLTTNEIEQELYNIGYELLTEYVSANEKIIVLCCNNHEWITTWGKIQSGRRCPYCSGKYNNYATIKTMIESEEGYRILSNDCNTLSDRLLIQCINQHVYEATGNTFKQGHRCPYCNESKGEKNISEILQEHNIYFIPQYKFNDCKFKHILTFDFYLPDFNICIEFDGEFHYKPIMGIDEFAKGYVRDDIKNVYCIENNIKLIRIPYWEKENLEEIILNELNIK